MSNESEIYLIKTKDGESFEYNNKKSFCKAFKKLSRKKYYKQILNMLMVLKVLYI